MSDAALDPVDLTKALWHAPLVAPDAHGHALEAAIRKGAGYGFVRQHLSALARLGLPVYAAACAARDRWPRSIDMARLALETSPPEMQQDALDRLAGVITSANRRRAVLASACWRLMRPDQGWQALADIDPESPSAVDDTFRRVDWAVATGDFARAEADLDWLAQRGATVRVAAQRLWLGYRRDGPAIAARQLEGPASQASRVCAALFEIFLNENDHARAPAALARWQDCPDAPSHALARAARRLTLEQGNGARATQMLHAALDIEAPWAWDPVDHLQWLRAGQLTMQPPEALLAHAHAACRVHPRHDWLAALARLLREGADDWSAIAAHRPASSTGERAFTRARASLRLGLPGRAACTLAPLRRMVGPMPQAVRVGLLRAEGFALAGRQKAAFAALERAQARARDALQRADCALQEAELHLLSGHLGRAEAALTDLGVSFPDRLPYLLTLARLAFAQGDFARAMGAHERFNTLKEIQTGLSSALDVRDRIVADACAAAQGQEASFAPETPVADTVAQLGAEQVIASPGVAACLLQRSIWRGELRFQPDPAARIPPVIAHYWQGPEGPAVPRARTRWAAMHPQFETRTFDEASAADWLKGAYGAGMRKRFLALSQPALRADLFRLCWLSQEGGVFADLDEYPRLPVTPWLEGARAVFCVERGFGTIANNFIAVTPAHPICQRALEFALAALDTADAPYAWWHTGPAQWTRAVMTHRLEAPDDLSVRYLSQSDYCRRISTNLPYPHKHSPDHWR